MECTNHLLNPHNKASVIGSSAVGLVHDLIIRKIKFKMEIKPYIFSATWDLAHILGASLSVAAKKFPFVADISGRFNSIYLYTDLIEHQLVGDFVVPLFCCVPDSGNNKEIITVMYDKLHDVPVNCQHIDTISIETNTNQNNHFSFCFGKVTVKLHLWPWKPLIF